ncbi:hypothetical protein ACXET9_09340 [Brachybacterium sp. DNPG3]
MRFESLTTAGAPQAEILALPGDADGHPPLPRLRLEWPLVDSSPDRLAVGTSLVFAPWMAGSGVFDEPLSPLTAQRLGEWFAAQGIWVSPGPVRSGGIVLPGGARRLRLVDGPGAAEQPACDGDDLRLQFVPAVEGSSTHGADIRVATTVGLLATHMAAGAEREAARVGAAVLVSASLRVGQIVAPRFATEHPTEFAAAARLLESVALGLVSE